MSKLPKADARLSHIARKVTFSISTTSQILKCISFQDAGQITNSILMVDSKSCLGEVLSEKNLSLEEKMTVEIFKNAEK